MMSAKNQVEKEIREAYIFLRENNSTIPSETLQFMLDSSLEKLNQTGFEVDVDFVNEMVNQKQKDLDVITDLVINTVYAKKLYREGGWLLVDEKLQNNYFNPNTSIHVRTVYDKLEELKIKTTLTISNEMQSIEKAVNEKLKVKAVEYTGSSIVVRL